VFRVETQQELLIEPNYILECFSLKITNCSCLTDGKIIFSSVVSFRPHIDIVQCMQIFELSRLCTGASWALRFLGWGGQCQCISNGNGKASTIRASPYQLWNLYGGESLILYIPKLPIFCWWSRLFIRKETQLFF